MPLLLVGNTMADLRRQILIAHPVCRLISLAKQKRARMTARHALTERDIKIAKVLRPLGTKPLSRQQARVASKLLDVHWTSVYRLRKRFLANPVASSVAPNARGPKAGGTRLDDQVEDIVDDVLGNWLPKQRQLAHPLLDLWTEVKRRCERSKFKPPARSTVARRWARYLEEKAAALAEAPGAQSAPGSFCAEPDRWRSYRLTTPNQMYSSSIPWFRGAIGRPWLTLAIMSPQLRGRLLPRNGASSAATVALLLSRVALPKAAWLAAIGADAQWPMQGIPQVLHLDDAAEFKSRALRSGCAQYGIELMYRPVGRPHFGGHIEEVEPNFDEAVEECSARARRAISVRTKAAAPGSRRVTLTESGSSGSPWRSRSATTRVSTVASWS